MISSSSSSSKSKCYITHGLLPSDLRIDKPGRSKKPFSTILASPWYSTVDLILPTELLSIIDAAIDRESNVLNYSRIHMKLEEVIEGDFFNVHIKTGNIEMLSQGSPVNDIQYSLREGILRLDVPKHIFQRLGLDGKPISSGGRKHVPNRMRIELNLRLPSMVSGRKGFERVRRAFKNVLNESVTWLFRDCKPATNINQADTPPVDKFHPLHRSAHPPIHTVLSKTVTPDLKAAIPPRNIQNSLHHLRSDMLDLLDWLSLLTLQSPRIDSDDDVNSYLCRYAIPSLSSTPPTSTSITTLHWQGFIPATWLSRIVALCTSVFQPNATAWFAINATTIKVDQDENSPDGWCLLVFPEQTGGEAGSVGKDGQVNDGDVSMEDGNQDRQTAKDVATDSQSRDFVLWELVDCITDR